MKQKSKLILATGISITVSIFLFVPALIYHREIPMELLIALTVCVCTLLTCWLLQSWKNFDQLLLRRAQDACTGRNPRGFRRHVRRVEKARGRMLRRSRKRTATMREELRCISRSRSPWLMCIGIAIDLVGCLGLMEGADAAAFGLLCVMGGTFFCYIGALGWHAPAVDGFCNHLKEQNLNFADLEADFMAGTLLYAGHIGLNIGDHYVVCIFNKQFCLLRNEEIIAVRRRIDLTYENLHLGSPLQYYLDIYTNDDLVYHVLLDECLVEIAYEEFQRRGIPFAESKTAQTPPEASAMPVLVQPDETVGQAETNQENKEIQNHEP